MYEKYFKYIFLLIICIGCRASTVNEVEHASNLKLPQLSPIVKHAFERSAEATVEKTDKNKSHHHHQHYYIEKPLESTQMTGSNTTTNGIPQKRSNIAYKPRTGEILVKDSVLYNKEAPLISQNVHKILATRRNYWPLVDNTVTSLASKAAAGANAVKNLLKVGFFHTFDNVNAAVEHKKHKIASYLIQAAQEHKIAMQQAKEDEKYKQQFKLGTTNLADVTQSITSPNHVTHPLLPLAKPLQQLLPLKQKLAQNIVQNLSKHLKKPIKKPSIAPPWIVYSKTKILPTTTVSDGYIHTFDNKYMPPNFEGHRERNPYADMGVTSYKHFEDTILKELEEKEERKVEATMHTLLDDQYVIHDSLEGTKPGSSQDWQPFNAHENGLFTTLKKPFTTNSFTQSTFDRPFIDVRPVCEHQDDIAIQPTLFVFPANAETHLNELQLASNDNNVKIKLTESNVTQTNLTQSNNSTTEKPNYPAYFIKQQQELRKLQQKLVGAYRTKNQYGTKATSIPARGRQNFYGRRTTTSTTTTTTTTTAPTTTELPIYYFSMNGTDDGFRPMLPNQINAMKIKKPNPIKLNTTLTSSSLSNHPKSWIQAQASNVKLSVVPAPNATKKRGFNVRTTIASRNEIKSSYIRKAPKKNNRYVW